MVAQVFNIRKKISKEKFGLQRTSILVGYQLIGLTSRLVSLSHGWLRTKMEVQKRQKCCYANTQNTQKKNKLKDNTEQVK